MEIRRLAPRLTMLAFPVGHVYVWQGGDGLTLIDTGVPGSAGGIERAIGELGHRPREVRRVLLTHCHEDHAGSAAEVAGWGDVEVVAHRRDAPVIRGEAVVAAPVLSAWEAELWARVHAGMAGDPAPPVRVDRELGDGDVIDLGGGVRAVAVAVPGHTPGSVAYHLPEPRVLFTGDTIARAPDGTVMLGVFNVDPEQAVRSFHRQAELDADIACFGHGLPLTGDAGAELRRAAEAQSARQPEK